MSSRVRKLNAKSAPDPADGDAGADPASVEVSWSGQTDAEVTPPGGRDNVASFRADARADAAAGSEEVFGSDEDDEALGGASAEAQSARYKRRARRRARRLGFDPQSDEEAIELLVSRGIDPMAPEADTSYEALLPVPAPQPAERPGVLLEQTIDEAADDQINQIEEIQQQLVERRRRRFMLLALRLIFFVFLPTLAVGIYYFRYATDMYETKSEFVIQQNEGGQGIGSLLGGTSFATATDSIVVQGFLTSKEAMLRLDEEHGYISHFQDERIDPIQRLSADATIDEAYGLYGRNVVVGYDLTEGVLRMDVIAATPEAAETFAAALAGYAEERVDDLTTKVREDALTEQRMNVTEAATRVDEAAETLARLQGERGVFSAEMEVTMLQSMIQLLMQQRQEKELELVQIQGNARPNQTQVEVLQAEIANLTTAIDERRSEMMAETAQGGTLLDANAELRKAEANLLTRQTILSEALSSYESARVEANRQVRYLSVSVYPIAPDVATYPRKFEYTVLAFLIFLAVYVLLSLTVSILREQMSYGN
ncbi:MAG: capsule biosynthesis protein [Pseudomonadota bacterium]